MPGPAESLHREIADHEATLARLAEEHQAVARRLATLKAQLVESKSAAMAPAPRTPAEKVALFRRRFRGRSDVYPVQFTSEKTGKIGYAPDCRNKFKPGVCELPRVKCGECPNQAFSTVSDDVLDKHLRGTHVVGVYPLLPGDTCHFLAADFDKSSWQEDAQAFVRAARTLGLSPTLERSRSGNGAHVWLFFAEPVAAATARGLGSLLITKAMSARHELGMDSYDRLFPNQDTMPRGGFGNLIALPLQGAAWKLGNTVFLDDDLQPIPDPWRHLANVPLLEAEEVGRLVADAARRDDVLGVRLLTTGDDAEDAAPWTRRPSGKPRARAITPGVPRTLNVVLAQRVFLETAALPSAFINQAKRLAAFQNPEFYKKQKMRLSTGGTPRVIACAEQFPHHIALPRACLSDLETLARDHGATLAIDDQRGTGTALDVEFHGTLTELQQKALEAIRGAETGVVVAPPGSGKTVLGARVVAERRCSTLVLVHRQPLVTQWVAQLSAFLGIAPREIGRVAGGRRKPNGCLDVATIQSLTRSGRVDDLGGATAR